MDFRISGIFRSGLKLKIPVPKKSHPKANSIEGKTVTEILHLDQLPHWGQYAGEWYKRVNFFLYQNIKQFSLLFLSPKGILIFYNIPAQQFVLAFTILTKQAIVGFYTILSKFYRIKQQFFIFPLPVIFIPLRFRKAERVWCGGARETH